MGQPVSTIADKPVAKDKVVVDGPGGGERLGKGFADRGDQGGIIRGGAAPLS